MFLSAATLDVWNGDPADKAHGELPVVTKLCSEILVLGTGQRGG
jgi:hypothetical protein